MSSQTGRCSPLLAQVPATVPSFGASQTGRCSPLLEVVSGVLYMASPLLEDGIRRVSISPTNTEPDPDDMEPCATPLPMEIDERPDVRGAYEVRLPAVTPVTPPAIGLSHAQWCDKILNESLPGDGFGRGCFDTLPRFVVGDPSARFETHTLLTYETNGETGQPLWKEIFGHILKECAYLTAFQTVYVMVDTRNLKAHETSQDGLPHWPAAVAWWHSRVQLVGPHHERTELLFFPATEETGLHRVHPTWAGTFVLAALVAVFPSINFILLDSDCLPITLFEAADLWKEGFLSRFPPGSGKGLPQQHPLHRRRDFVNRPDVVYTQHRVNADRQGQGVLLVTEPHSELNAGLVVVFSSAHPSIFNWSEWTRRCRRLPDSEYDSLLSSASEEVVQEVLQLMTSFLHRTLSCTDLFFFCCIAERAIKPCRSSRSKLRGEFGIPRHLQNRNQKHTNKATRPNNNTKQTKTRAGKCWNVKREVRKGDSILHGPQFTRKATMDPVRVSPVSVSRHMHSVLD